MLDEKPKDTEEAESFVFRMATARGDLIMTWKDNIIHVNGYLSTERERTKIQSWAKEHGLTVDGNLAKEATIQYKDPPKLEAALRTLVGKEVGDAGYIVYTVGLTGKGKVVQHKDMVPESLKGEKIVKVPKIGGG